MLLLWSKVFMECSKGKLKVDTILSCVSAVKVFVHTSIRGNADIFRFLATIETRPTK